jgi:hypothetical protein
MKSSLRVIVTGLIAQHRLLGGVAWDYINIVLGLKRLGHDVYYMEDSGEWPYNFDGGAGGNEWSVDDPKPNIKSLANVMSQFGLGHKWAYRFPTKQEWFGLSADIREEVIRSADLLINVSGTLEHPSHYRQVQKLVYLDTDPVFTQIAVANGNSELRARIDAHDVHFTVGECLGPAVPDTGHKWHPTKHPIVLGEWRSSLPYQNTFTTVMNWTSYKPLAYHGRTYGQKDVEFVKFMNLPQQAHSTALEVALPKLHHVRWQSHYEKVAPQVQALIENHRQWTPHEMLKHLGWRVIDATEVCCDFTSYRQYIQSSKGEWSIAKNGYVDGKSGWFSGRSACYLAAGRPIVVQDTGFSQVLPVGQGVLSFNTLEEAAAGLEEVEHNYRQHSKAATAIAETYFDSDKVLSRIITKAFSAG